MKTKPGNSEKISKIFDQNLSTSALCEIYDLKYLKMIMSKRNSVIDAKHLRMNRRRSLDGDF